MPSPTFRKKSNGGKFPVLGGGGASAGGKSTVHVTNAFVLTQLTGKFG